MDWEVLVIGVLALAVAAGFVAISGGNGFNDCDGSCGQGREACDCRYPRNALAEQEQTEAPVRFWDI